VSGQPAFAGAGCLAFALPQCYFPIPTLPHVPLVVGIGASICSIAASLPATLSATPLCGGGLFRPFSSGRSRALRFPARQSGASLAAFDCPHPAHFPIGIAQWKSWLMVGRLARADVWRRRRCSWLHVCRSPLCASIFPSQFPPGVRSRDTIHRSANAPPERPSIPNWFVGTGSGTWWRHLSRDSSWAFFWAAPSWDLLGNSR